MSAKISKLVAIVAEEDYEFSLYDFDEYSAAVKERIESDARDLDVSFVYIQEWIIADGDFSLYASLNELMGREYVVLTATPIGEET